ncbi:unnamed protein product [Choristocarpus tenellus]
MKTKAFGVLTTLATICCCDVFAFQASPSRSLQRPHLPRLSFSGDGMDSLSFATHMLADAVGRGGTAVADQVSYVPRETIENFPQIVVGSGACVLAYAWAAYEFGKRIVTQRRCAVCNGSGLVSSNRDGVHFERPRKCYACGGFLPWENWGRFWQSNMDVGNGGVLQRPARDYDALNKAARETQGDTAGDS